MATRALPRPSPVVSGVFESPQRGAQLGRYELLSKLASGGMAEVWTAEQAGALGFRRLVAIKTIHPKWATRGDFRMRFLEEARLASQIHHANVVETLDLGEEGGIVYQAMTLIEGAALSSIAPRDGRVDRLPLGVVIRIVSDALRGLHAAHTLTDESGAPLGLVHCDVSPQNILVGLDGVSKLADFGIAKAFDAMRDIDLDSSIEGKIPYLAPEQLEHRAATPASDIFAVGVVLWEALTGRPLFAVSNDERGARERRNRDVPDPRSVARDVPPGVAAIALRALETEPSRRYPTAIAMADALELEARNSGAPATHQEVARVVDARMGETLRARREAVRAARAGRSGAPPPLSSDDIPTVYDAQTTVFDPQPPGETPSRRGRFAAVGLGALLVVGVAVGFSMPTRAGVPTQAASPATARSIEPSPAPPVPSAPPVEPSPSGAEHAKEPTPAPALASARQPASGPATAAKKSPARRVQPVTSEKGAAVPKPPFDSPYR